MTIKFVQADDIFKTGIFDKIIGYIPQDPQLLYAILLAVTGIALIVILEKFGNKAKS